MPTLKQSLTIALVSIVAVAIAKQVPFLSGLMGPATAPTEPEPPLVLGE
jgi:hypothetical protein